MKEGQGQKRKSKDGGNQQKKHKRKNHSIFWTNNYFHIQSCVSKPIEMNLELKANFVCWNLEESIIWMDSIHSQGHYQHLFHMYTLCSSTFNESNSHGLTLLTDTWVYKGLIAVLLINTRAWNLLKISISPAHGRVV